MGTATYGGAGFQERTRVNGKSPIGAANFRQLRCRAQPATCTHPDEPSSLCGDGITS